VKHEVADRIGALDGVGVAVERLEEPRVSEAVSTSAGCECGDILSGDKLARLLIGPQLVLVVGVQVEAALLGALPVRGDALVLVRLVDDFGDQLRALVDGARVWRRELAAEDGVLATGGDQQAEQGPHAVHCEAEDDDGDEHEDGDAALHGGLLRCAAVSFSLAMLGVDQGQGENVAGAGWRR
jgi:hypothetical protein